MAFLLARADARSLPLRDESVQCVVTSPPYFGLRDYDSDEQIGVEDTVDEYVNNIVAVFREIRRVLRKDGTAWLNLGDSYCGGGGFAPNAPVNVRRRVMLSDGVQNDGGFGIRVSQHVRNKTGGVRAYGSLKNKDLVGAPWRVALALQADGWWLRSDVIWSKPNPMPENVTDRPTRAHEYMFLLARSSSYYYDMEAVKEQRRSTLVDEDGRNLRSVWTITTQSFKGAHYATFPEKLVEPCILAGTSAKGACTKCGAPWERADEDEAEEPIDDSESARPHSAISSSIQRSIEWRPTCGCGIQATRPCVVLDPFCGTGTVGRVSIRHNRSAVCVDISDKYLKEFADKRTHGIQIELLR